MPTPTRPMGNAARAIVEDTLDLLEDGYQTLHAAMLSLGLDDTNQTRSYMLRMADQLGAAARALDALMSKDERRARRILATARRKPGNIPEIPE